MRALQLAKPGDRLSLLCLGAHSDDIEIGAGAMLLGLMDRGIKLDVHWCVLSGGGVRDDEARKSANDFLAKAHCAKIEIKSFRDGFFPEQGEAIKQWFDDETFRGLARIRGMECRAPERYAEAFFARKVALI